jgi:hypothetical protein
MDSSREPALSATPSSAAPASVSSPRPETAPSPLPPSLPQPPTPSLRSPPLARTTNVALTLVCRSTGANPLLGKSPARKSAGGGGGVGAPPPLPTPAPAPESESALHGALTIRNAVIADAAGGQLATVGMHSRITRRAALATTLSALGTEQCVAYGAGSCSRANENISLQV